MVHGLDIFQERFRGFGESLVLIGGAACDEWFRRLGMSFRATQDLDIVLILEAVNGDFVAAMRGFVAEGGYAVRQRSEGGPPILYRFSKPQDARFPAMLEIFSRLPEGVELSADQGIVPIPTGEGPHSLSAILIHPDYHALIREQRETRDGIAAPGARRRKPSMPGTLPSIGQTCSGWPRPSRAALGLNFPSRYGRTWKRSWTHSRNGPRIGLRFWNPSGKRLAAIFPRPCCARRSGPTLP